MFLKWKFSFGFSLLGWLSALFIFCCFIFSVFCYVIAPDNSNNANMMHLDIHSKAIGYQTKVIRIPSFESQSLIDKMINGSNKTLKEVAFDRYTIHEDWVYFFKEKNPTYAHFKLPLSKFRGIDIGSFIENKTFYFGTDRYGRDLLSRVIVGLRISFFIGFISVFISLFIGVSLGSISGFYGGFIDRIIVWIINVSWSIPTLLLVISISLVLGKGFWQVFIAVGLTMWVEVARIVRGQILSIKNSTYIEAAHLMGFNHFRIITKHILPHCFGPLLVVCASNFAAAILIESGLSFLGLGVMPPTPSWGSIIKDHYYFLVIGKIHLALIPGLAIASLVLAFMLFGFELKNFFDKKNKQFFSI